MHWEIWSIRPANMVTDRPSDTEALEIVRELQSLGWQAEELSLIAEDASLPVESLPPALTGPALMRRAEQTASELRRPA